MLSGLRRPEVPVILRWAAHIPTFMAMREHGFYTAAASIDRLSDISSGQTLLQGLKVAGITTLVVFPWNFVMFAVAGCLAVEASGRSPIFVLIGSIDLLLAFVLSIGVIQQAQYLPNNLGSCDKAISWRAHQGERSFFALATASRKFIFIGDDEREICRSLIGGWALTIAIIGYLLIASFVNFNIAFDFSQCDADTVVKYVGDTTRNCLSRMQSGLNEKFGRFFRHGRACAAKDTQSYTSVNSDDELSMLGAANKDDAVEFDDFDGDEIKGAAERPRDSFDSKE